MYNGYKVVCNTAAGRRRYMQYLIPQVICSDIVDRYDIWVNTVDKLDIAFFQQLASKYDKINLVWQPDGVINGIKSINAFYTTCLDEQTVYIKLDDDIVWLEPDFFSKMLEFRFKHKESFVVSPLVINNSACMYILQVNGKIEFAKYQPSTSRIWRRGTFATEYHQWFIEKYLSTNTYDKLYCNTSSVAARRFSINSIIWFGDSLKKIDGIVPGDDEEFLSSIYPTMLGVDSKINGNCIISHFAFAMQREELDKSGILDLYGAILRKEFAKDSIKNEILKEVDSAILYINENRKEIQEREIQYRHIPQKKSIAQKWRVLMRRIRCSIDKINNISYIKQSI